MGAKSRNAAQSEATFMRAGGSTWRAGEQESWGWRRRRESCSQSDLLLASRIDSAGMRLTGQAFVWGTQFKIIEQM